jgi:UDP:flavonoid glycosyltransferase YjiC (YdhE family)
VAFFFVFCGNRGKQEFMQARAVSTGNEFGGRTGDFGEMLNIPGDNGVNNAGGPDKPVILVFPFNFLSHYLRCIVLSELLRVSYDILFAADHAYNGFVHRNDFSTFDCVGWRGESILGKLKVFDFSWLNEHELERLFWERVAAIDIYKPKVVIGDNDPVLKMAAEYTGVWYVSLHNGYMTKYFAGERAISRRHTLWPLMNRLPKRLRFLLVRLGEAYSMRRIHAPFRRLRRRLGLRRSVDYIDELEGDMNLICDLTELFPQVDLPPNYYQVGPMIYDESSNDRYKLSALQEDKKTIYVNLGSTGDWESVAFLNDPYYKKYNIVTAGDAAGIVWTASARFSFLSASAIFPYTDLVICHGGNGIINQALYFKKRILCKTTYFEQEWNADAVERAGWGKTLDGVESVLELREIIDNWVSKGEQS